MAAWRVRGRHSPSAKPSLVRLGGCSSANLHRQQSLNIKGTFSVKALLQSCRKVMMGRGKSGSQGMSCQ